MSALLQDAYVLIADHRFTQVKELLPILEGVSQKGKSLLIIAEDVDGEALATLIVNKMRGTLQVVAVKAPDFGERRKLILEDIAILTGGTVFDKEKGSLLKVKDSAIRIKLELAKLQSDIIKNRGDVESTINERSQGSASLNDFKSIRDMIKNNKSLDDETELF